MNSFVVFGVLVAVIFALCGTAQGQGKACLEITKCIGADFNKAVKDRKGDKAKLCRHFKEAIDCMNPKIEACLPTIDASMGSVFTQQRDEMQSNMETVCKDQPGIASSSGCSQEKMQACQPLMGELTTAGSQGMAGLCAAIKKLRDCIDGTGCSGAVTDAFDKAISTIDPDGTKCADGGAPPPSAGTCNFQACNTKSPECEMYKCFTMAKNACPNKSEWDTMYSQDAFKKNYDRLSNDCPVVADSGPSLCDFSPCATKKDCAMYNCQMSVKDKCEDKSIWDTMYKVETFKKAFDSMTEKCGCGSLKPSLLFVLASAISMLLRSRF